MAAVETVREDLIAVLPKYQLIRDLLKGELAVKAATTKYLPVPNEKVKAEDPRYKAYILRAVLYNVTHRTVEGLVGQVFLRDPVIEVSDILQHVIDDANAADMSITQMAKMTVTHTIAYGRAGLFTDYPSVDGIVSKEDLINGVIRPTINFYAPWDIINWQRQKVDDRNLLTLVVLREIKTIETEFEITADVRYRVLRLIRENENRLCTSVQLWAKTEPGGDFVVIENYILCDATGQPLREIPFDFVGSNNNDDLIDDPPIYDIASLNIAHYRNSADYEESAFMVGQPTPVFAGLTEHWVNEVLKGDIVLGSRSAIPLPEKGTAMLLQADPNTLARDAMDHKEGQMYALGAKLVQERVIEATATEVEIQNSSENSVLSTAAKNVQSAFLQALHRAAGFIGEAVDDIKFELNTNFDLTTMTADETRIGAELWANFSAITTSEVREILRRSGLASLTDEEYLIQVVADKALKDKLGINQNETQEGSDNRSTVN